jgi:hypothetical protein
MTKDLPSFSPQAEASLYFSLGIEFLEKQMLGRASGENGMVLHSVYIRQEE